MFARDTEFLLQDLGRHGATSTVQLQRPTKAGRTSGGRVQYDLVDVAVDVEVFLSQDDSALENPPEGEAVGQSAIALFTPDVDVRVRDEFSVTEGYGFGQRFRVTGLPPAPMGPKRAQVERMKVPT